MKKTKHIATEHKLVNSEKELDAAVILFACILGASPCNGIAPSVLAQGIDTQKPYKGLQYQSRGKTLVNNQNAF
jgi:hypothetical protein